MNIARTKTVVELDKPQTVDSLTEAKQVSDALDANRTMAKKDRDAYNGLLEAFFVGHFRTVPKGSLTTAIREVQAQFPNDKRLARALHRVKAFRSKNKAWKNVQI